MKRKRISLGRHIILSNLLKEDLPFLKKWRNEQMDILRQSKPLTDKDQEKFYKKLKRDKNQVLFSILDKNGRLIGYCGIVHIDWENKRGEISFILETGTEKRHSEYSMLFLETMVMLRDYAFKKLILHKIFTETWAFRKFHINLLEKSGFKRDARLPDHVWKKNRFSDSLIHSIINKK